ncbi:non-homologous end joining protein Ku [Motilibacter rhizosphaerae]|nr:Ku protein [Motilibacter rhizosphaerae]
MQAIWKGTVSFGLVSIPVRLYAATEEKGISFRQVHDADGGRIRYKRVCSVDGEEVAYRDIVKGYELPDGEMVVLTDDDLGALPLPTKRVIDVLEFVPLDQVDGIYLSKPYFLAAEGPGTKPYVLLRDALEAAGRAALVKVALRNRESLAVLRPKDGALLVQTMLWPDEVRDAGAFAPDEAVEVRDQEVAMAQSYIETLSGDFDPEQFSDDYRVALEELVEAKVSGRAVQEPAEQADTGGTVVDLMAALRASVEAARSRRGDEGTGSAAGAGEAAAPERAPAEAAPKKAAPKRAARKKAAGEKAAVEEAPAKKAPARRAAAEQAAAEEAPAKKAPAKKAPARKASTTGEGATGAPATKAAAKRPPAKKAPARKATAGGAASQDAPAATEGRRARKTA